MFQNPNWIQDDVVASETLGRIAERLSESIRTAFLSADDELIKLCSSNNMNYVSSTGVTAFFWRNILTIAHIGDSRACIAKISDGLIRPEWLTIDHKPNTPAELKRIESCGGSLVWLHGIKPYIRYFILK
jgi:serine/threonine protein phosphatase PrpC